MKTNAECLAMLRELVKPGDTVHTVLRSVSRSGMSRKIDLYFFAKNGSKHYLSGYAANVCGWSRDKQGAIKVSGCGMDMGFSLVYSLSRTLFPAGFVLPKGMAGRNNDTSGHDRDGGYALKHEWI